MGRDPIRVTTIKQIVQLIAAYFDNVSIGMIFLTIRNISLILAS